MSKKTKYFTEYFLHSYDRIKTDAEYRFMRNYISRHWKQYIAWSNAH